MIAIPNMEMPKDCWECQMFGTWEGVGEFSCFLDVKIKDIDIRPTDCPLIDIAQCWECIHKDDICHYCHEHERNIKDNDFCSYGERKE